MAENPPPSLMEQRLMSVAARLEDVTERLEKRLAELQAEREDDDAVHG